MKTFTLVHGFAAIGAAAFAITARAEIMHTFDWDGAPSGTAANSFTQPTGLDVSFNHAALLPLRDEFGDAIPGTERWRIDESAPTAIVDNPENYGRGVAPSPVNALDALFQPVLITFATPFSLDPAGFEVTLDNDTFGANGNLPGNADIAVQFLDTDLNPLAIVPVDQTTPGFIATGGDLAGVAAILLPAGAFYDDVFISGVPEPTTGLLLTLSICPFIRRR